MNRTSTKPIAVIVNPSSGRGRGEAKKRSLEKALLRHAVVHELVVSQSEEHLRRLVPELAERFGALAIAGGDSSLFIAVGELLAHKLDVPLGIIGLGSCNDLTRELGIRRLHEACRAIGLRRTRRIDLGRLESEGKLVTFFPGQVSFGLAVEVNRRIAEAAQKPSLLGRNQTIAGIKAVRQSLRSPSLPLHLRIETDGEPLEGEYILGLFSNIRYYAAGFMAAPAARPDDGLLDALLIRPASFPALLSMGFRAALGRALPGGKCIRLQAKNFRITAQAPFALQVDGNIWAGEAGPQGFREIVIGVVPSAISIFA